MNGPALLPAGLLPLFAPHMFVRSGALRQVRVAFRPTIATTAERPREIQTLADSV